MTPLQKQLAALIGDILSRRWLEKQKMNKVGDGNKPGKRKKTSPT